MKSKFFWYISNPNACHVIYKYLILSGILFFASDLFAQSGYVRQLSIPNKEVLFWGHCLTSDGGYAMSAGLGQPPYDCSYFLRADSQHNIIWSRKYSSFPGVRYRFNSIMQLSDSGFMIVGQETDDTSANNLVITRLDTIGNVVFSKRYHDASSGFGSTFFEAFDDSTFLVTGGAYGMGTVVFDINGNILAAKNFQFRPGVVGPIGWKPTLLNDGNIIVPGFGYNSQTGFNEGYLVKLDRQLNVLWSRSYFTNNTFQVYHIAYDNDGNIYTDFISTNSITGLLKTDSLGNVIWCKAYNFNNPGSVNFWGLKNYGNEMLALTSSLILNDRVTTLLQVDTSGSILNHTSYHELGVNLYPEAHYIRPDNRVQIFFKDFVVSEFFGAILTDSSINSSCEILPATINDSLMMIQDTSIIIESVRTLLPTDITSAVSSVSVAINLTNLCSSPTALNSENEEISVYVSYSNALITVDGDFTNKVVVRIFNVLGQELYSGIHHGNRLDIPFDKPRGIYFVNLENQCKQNSYKIFAGKED